MSYVDGVMEKIVKRNGNTSNIWKTVMWKMTHFLTHSFFKIKNHNDLKVIFVILAKDGWAHFISNNFSLTILLLKLVFCVLLNVILIFIKIKMWHSSNLYGLFSKGYMEFSEIICYGTNTLLNFSKFNKYFK